MLTKYKLKFPIFIAKKHLCSATFVILRLRRGNIGDRISVKDYRSLPESLLKLKNDFEPIGRLIRYSISTKANIEIRFRQVFVFFRISGLRSLEVEKPVRPMKNHINKVL